MISSFIKYLTIAPSFENYVNPVQLPWKLMTLTKLKDWEVCNVTNVVYHYVPITSCLHSPLSISLLSIALVSLYLYPYSGFSKTLWSQCCPGIVKRVEESCLPLLASTASIMTEFSSEWLDYYIMWYTCVRVVHCRMSSQTAASRLLNKIGFAETTHPTYVCLLYTCT